MRNNRLKILLGLLMVLLAGMNLWAAWDLYEFQKPGKDSTRTAIIMNLKKRFEAVLTGKAKGEAKSSWGYNNKEKWFIFYKANFTGKEPPKKKVEKKEVTKEVKKTPSHPPISDIVELL